MRPGLNILRRCDFLVISTLVEIGEVNFSILIFVKSCFEQWRRGIHAEILCVRNRAYQLQRAKLLNPSKKMRRAQEAGTELVPPGQARLATQTVVETSKAPTLDTFVHNLDSTRYQLIEKKENEEVYLDKQTGNKWAVKVEKKD